MPPYACIGDFVRGEMHGEGTLQLPGGAGTYSGGFRGNAFHGAGELRLAAGGEEYDGDWAAGRRCGQGTCRYANGDVYEVGVNVCTVRKQAARSPACKAVGWALVCTWLLGPVVVAERAAAERAAGLLWVQGL